MRQCGFLSTVLKTICGLMVLLDMIYKMNGFHPLMFDEFGEALGIEEELGTIHS